MSNRPVVIVQPRQDQDYHKIPVTGGDIKVFDFDEQKQRKKIHDSFVSARSLLAPQFKKYPDFPGVIKVVVREDAIAKSHRPEDFIGSMKVLTYGLPTEIYLSAFDDDLLKAISNSNDRKTNRYVANLSTIVSVQAITSINKKKTIDGQKSMHDVVIKFFEYEDKEKNVRANNLMDAFANTIGANYETIKIGDKICSNIMKGIGNDDIELLAEFPFVMSVREMINICPLDSNTSPIKPFLSERTYNFSDKTIIGVVDGGISKEAIDNRFIYGVENYIPKDYQDNTHGTFVASTILFGNEMNKRNEASPTHFQLLDVVAVPKKNSNIRFYEDEFCECLREVVEKHHDKVKIWNLSLGFPDIIASDDAVSDIGAFCDILQEEYKVQFIISSGNYVDGPLRVWPVPIGDDRDRVIAPADSLLALTVASMAEYDSNGSLSKKGEPSPFSRRGPGAGLLFKPDLIDYGGNMFSDYTFENIGIKGLDLDKSIYENIGTSFSAPLVSYKLAKIYSSLIDKNMLLSKAFLIHDSLINSPHIVDCNEEERKYYGFGQPSIDCETVLDCKDNSITFALECELFSGTMIDIRDFPYPQSLMVDGKCKGEIFATLVAEPSFDKKFGSEYSRVDFDLSIGTFANDEENNKIAYHRQVSPITPGCGKNKYESELVEEDLKWNPIKTYHRKFSDGTVIKDGWRILVKLHSRFQEPNKSHKCYVLITIIGNDDAIYDETIEAFRARGFSYDEVKIASENRYPVKP